MPRCYHCGTEVSELFHCTKCGQSYCSIHKDPIDHECNIVIESLNFTPQYAVPSQTTPPFTQQSGLTESITRGTTDGTSREEQPMELIHGIVKSKQYRKTLLILILVLILKEYY